MSTLTESDALALIQKRRLRMPAASFVDDRLATRRRRVAAGRRFADLSSAEIWAEFLPIAGAATNFSVTLDTTSPGSPTLAIAAGASYATAQATTANISTSDGSTTGYQIKVWGNVDLAANANIQDTEGNSAWIAYSTAQAITLSAGDGSKSISMRIRDDVWNQTSIVTDTITLDTTMPVPNVTVGPDVTRVSKVSGKRTVSFTFQSDTAAQAWKVKVVPATGSLETAGTTIPTTAGSTAMTGGTLAAATPQACTIDGADLETASSGDGAKIVKVFVQDDAGNWSI